MMELSDMGEYGKGSIVIGKAEAHASVAGGFYVIGVDNEKI